MPAAQEPATVEEYVETGALEEESGDRWLGSDITKALRFYQRAYTNYLKAIHLDKARSNFDGFYNASRLLFHVYNQYFKTDGVDVYSLVNIAEVLTGDQSSVIQNLSDIVTAHEQACLIGEQLFHRIPQDLLYNMILVYTEVLEVEQENNAANDFQEILQLGLKVQQLIRQLITDQCNEVEKFVVELGKATDANYTAEASTVTANEQQREEEYTSETVVQPEDIFETVLTGFRMCQAVYENVANVLELAGANEAINPFIAYLENVATELKNFNNEALALVTENQVKELTILRQYMAGLSTNDLDQILAGWNDAGLPATEATYMLAADNIQTFIDRNDLTLMNPDMGLVYWKALTNMDAKLKLAANIIQHKYNDKKKLPSGSEGNSDLSSLISQLSDIMIARSDIDLQRCQLDIDVAKKNAEVIFKNSKTFLKNAMNLANTSGGLRERASEKLTREYRKVQAVIRLCLLEGKTSIQELDTILGRHRWQAQLPGLVNLGFFEKFGTRSIQVDESS